MGISRERTVYVLFFAFILFTCQFGLLLYMLTANPNRAYLPDPAALRPYLYVLAELALLLAIGQALLRMPLASTLPRFQTSMIIALACAAGCSVLGIVLFFLGGSAAETYRLFAATLIVDFAFILPQVMRRI